MRWDELFADLEAQLEDAAGGRAGRGGGRPDPAGDRQAGAGRPGSGRGRARGRAAAARGRAGRACPRRRASGCWSPRRRARGPGAVAAVVSGGLRACPGAPGSGGRVFARLGLGSALRGIARDRCRSVWLTDGSVVTGTVDRVGADFVEVAEHGAGEPRGVVRSRGVRTVPFAALALVRSGALTRCRRYLRLGPARRRPGSSSACRTGGSLTKSRVSVVHPRDVVLELARLDPPLAAAADLDRGQVAAPRPGRRPARRRCSGPRRRRRAGGSAVRSRDGQPQYACGASGCAAVVHRARRLWTPRPAAARPGVRQDDRRVVRPRTSQGDRVRPARRRRARGCPGPAGSTRGC